MSHHDLDSLRLDPMKHHDRSSPRRRPTSLRIPNRRRTRRTTIRREPRMFLVLELRNPNSHRGNRNRPVKPNRRVQQNVRRRIRPRCRADIRW